MNLFDRLELKGLVGTLKEQFNIFYKRQSIIFKK